MSRWQMGRWSMEGGHVLLAILGVFGFLTLFLLAFDRWGGR